MERDLLLRRYLADHLVDLDLAIELAGRLGSRAPDGPLRAYLQELLVELRAERLLLAETRDRVGGGRARVHRSVSWAAEKLARLKLADTGRRSAELSRVLELEALCAAVEMKLSLWVTLGKLQRLDERLSGIDFRRLVGRAKVQRTRLEALRMEAAMHAFPEDRRGLS